MDEEMMYVFYRLTQTSRLVHLNTESPAVYLAAPSPVYSQRRTKSIKMDHKYLISFLFCAIYRSVLKHISWGL